jgi:Flp pilus assembly protein TadG
MKKLRRKGQSLVEFTLVCIPLIFILLSIVELSRFMWCYHTLAFAVERGARYAVVHGKSSSTSVSAVAGIIRSAATGLDSGQMTVELQAASSTQNCAPLRNCEQLTTQWPDATSNTPGQSVTVAAVYPFRTAMSMFWPGAGSVRFGVVNMSATATEEIRF